MVGHISVADTALVFLWWTSLAQESDEAYLQKCYGIMDEQLRKSHIQDVACQQKISGVYCARLLEVERPQPFIGQCRSDVPTAEATEMVYQDFQSISLAVLILAAYQSQLMLIKELIRSLWHPRHSFLIHVDKKAPTLQKSLDSWAKDFANIHVRSRISVKRSGASLLAAEIDGLQELLTLSDSWHYFVLLSDSDQLVRPVNFLQRILSQNHGLTFINTEVFNASAKSIAVECDERVHAVRMAGHEDGIPMRPDLKMASGSQFVVLHRSFAEFATQLGEAATELILRGPTHSARIKNESLPRQVLNEVLFFASPDETYFHSLAVNSHFCSSHLRYNFHFHHTQGHFLDESSKRYTDYPTGSPPVLTLKELPLLMEVRAQHPIIFARKFDLSNSSSIRLEELHPLQRSLQNWVPVPGNWTTAFTAVIAGKVTGAEQLTSSTSVFDHLPRSYRLQLQDVPYLQPVLRQAKAKGILWLTERYATPKESLRLEPLQWIRVGAGWDSSNFQFQGAMSVISMAEASQGLWAAFYWHLGQSSQRVEIRWLSPSGQARLTQQDLADFQLFSVSKAPQGILETGWWSIEVRQPASSGRRQHAKIPEEVQVISRRFFLYDTETPKSHLVAAVEEMFSHAIPENGVSS